MIEPVSLTVAVAGVAVAGRQLALQRRDEKRNKKQDALAAAQGIQGTSQAVVLSQSAPKPSQATAPAQPATNPYTSTGYQPNALPNAMIMNGFNADGSQAWATMTTTETICMQNGRPVTKESKLELLQSIQYQQMQASTLPMMANVVAVDSKPQMPQSYPAVSDSKMPMLPMHCSIAQGVPVQNSASWQQTAPPPPYEAHITQPMAHVNQPIRKRDRWIHFK